MLSDQIADDLKQAMRAQDKVRLRTLRSLRAALTEAEINEREAGEGALDEQQTLSVLQKQAKQRKEALTQYEDAGRADLAEKERAELAVIEEYLPEKLSDEELRDILQTIIEDKEAKSMADMGKVMGAAMQRMRGRADGNRVRRQVERLLSENG